MSKYIPKVGDRIHNTAWFSSGWVDVKCVGESTVFGIHSTGQEDVWPLDDDWIKVEVPAPLPELWITQFTRGVSIHMDDPARRLPGSGEGLIVTTHLVPEGDGYRVEVKRHTTDQENA